MPLFTGLALAAGAVLGGVAGHATVSGMRPDAIVVDRVAGAYGVPVKPADAWLDGTGTAAPDLDYQTAAASRPDAGDPAPVEQVRYAIDCADCSDWELGYRYATARALRSVARCRMDSWSFERGCEAAVADAVAHADRFDDPAA